MLPHGGFSNLTIFLIFLTIVPMDSKRASFPEDCHRKQKRAGSSLLWRVNTTPASYFFGTIHVPYERVWRYVPDNVKRAFHYSQAVYFELRLTDPHTVRALTSCQLLPVGQQLQQLIPDQLFKRLERHLSYVRHMLPIWLSGEQRHRGVHAQYLFNAIVGNWRLKRPIWVMLMVNTLTEGDIRSRGSPVLDLFLAQQAERLSKLTGAVERVEEQCEPLNNLNMSQVIFALNHTLTQQEQVRAGVATLPLSTDDLIHHYNCGQLDRAIFDRDSSQLSPSVFKVPPLQSSLTFSARYDLQRAQSIDQYFRNELIYKRNQRMGERILELLWQHPSKSFFFAFGAGHFLGNFTVLDVVKQAGYKVTRVGRHERIRRFHRRRLGPLPDLVENSRSETPPSADVNAENIGERQKGRIGRLSVRRASKVAERQIDSFSDLWIRMESTSDERERETWLSSINKKERGLFSRTSDAVALTSLRLLTLLVTAITVLTPARI